MEMNLRTKLLKLQEELKAPKGQYNSFGKYRYRSCEDILEAVKPLLVKYDLSLTIKDDIVAVGDRIYVKAEAYLVDNKTDAGITNTAFAREDETNKGMSASQITGTASSYARKYCLNGLFLIDDTKDADTDENRMEQENRGKAETEVKYATDKQIEIMREISEKMGRNDFNPELAKKMTIKQASDFIKKYGGNK